MHIPFIIIFYRAFWWYSLLITSDMSVMHKEAHLKQRVKDSDTVREAVVSSCYPIDYHHPL